MVYMKCELLILGVIAGVVITKACSCKHQEIVVCECKDKERISCKDKPNNKCKNCYYQRYYK